MADGALAGGDDVEEAERRLAAHELGIAEVRRRRIEARRVGAAAVGALAVAGDAVLGEQRAAARGRRRRGRIDLPRRRRSSARWWRGSRRASPRTCSSGAFAASAARTAANCAAVAPRGLRARRRAGALCASARNVFASSYSIGSTTCPSTTPSRYSSATTLSSVSARRMSAAACGSSVAGAPTPRVQQRQQQGAGGEGAEARHAARPCPILKLIFS